MPAPLAHPITWKVCSEPQHQLHATWYKGSGAKDSRGHIEDGHGVCYSKYLMVLRKSLLRICVFWACKKSGQQIILESDKQGMVKNGCWGPTDQMSECQTYRAFPSRGWPGDTGGPRVSDVRRLVLDISPRMNRKSTACIGQIL